MKFALIAAAAFAWAAISSSANASWLFWSKVSTREASEKQCYDRAVVVGGSYLKNLRRSALEVAGDFVEPRSGHVTYVAITCIARSGGQPTMAVIMAVGEVEHHVKSARGAVAMGLECTPTICY